MPVKSTISREGSLAAYFKKRLQRFSQASPPHDDTLWYLSHMLERYGQSRELFEQQQGLSLQPLALLYFDALATNNKREKLALLRKLGDQSLFLAALFPEYFARRGIRKDYMVGMGGAAYYYVAEASKQQAHIFSELATGFARLLSLVSQACSKEHFFDAQDILLLHQRWLNNKDQLAEQQLRAVGIIPIDPSWQH
ncbi:hypothetical protein NO559_00745 [Dasania sp. GY-MA-18]|uniref:Uncharacterized protein n=1 Tax=Dasania phycosphaerae TaxID=2950436 RepID=A0A9J6RHF7_9GAMM|nr:MULTISPECIES: hypothetical protein [Dasania]MCR8921276.1 hypothetical protein [Dasania sp. GY-MA-18]MCZ0863704.1 hypothetical protein [Dasania phycosphaerae]MCZ0867432.1 hypothetical protein [Dasania phycosphaerae]